ncbi:MAG: efflux RND transporter permease subunit [Gammaproteobacteria bacterium]|nr:efflux RND transporter permease subunit [Gammaproteobacteria bacterium]
MPLIALLVLRPVASVLILLGLCFAGALAYFQLAVTPLPHIEFPTISVSAYIPGASPETMSNTVATPLERFLGTLEGIRELSSNSSQGSTRVSIQFNPEKDVSLAEKEVQAALQAASSSLSADLPNPPTYRKVNPADTPILILALMSSVVSRGEMYDLATTTLGQKLSQIPGVGQVTFNGGALPAVRIDIYPEVLELYKISLEEVRLAVLANHSNRPKGIIEHSDKSWRITSNSHLTNAQDYASIIVRYQDEKPIYLRDLARVYQSVQDLKNTGLVNATPAISISIYKQANANVIETIDKIKERMPQFQSMLPATVELQAVLDRTTNLRASINEMQKAFLWALFLVIAIVGIFLKRLTATAVVIFIVPATLATTAVTMYFLQFSLNNLSILALIIAIGFVIDDVIVVIENICRKIDRGLAPQEATISSMQEIGFTIIGISLALCAVFLPILLMGDILGQLLHEFSVIIISSVIASMLIAITLTPALCAQWLSKRAHPPSKPRIGSKAWRTISHLSQKILLWHLRHQYIAWLALLSLTAGSYFLFQQLDKIFFPQQDTGRIFVVTRAEQGSSFQNMQRTLEQVVDIVQQDPAVEYVSGNAGSGGTATMAISLKPLKIRQESVQKIISRLRLKLNAIAGLRTFLVAGQDMRMGAIVSNSEFQYTVKADSLEELRRFSPLIRKTLGHLPELTDVDSEYEDNTTLTYLHIDRDALSRYGLSLNSVLAYMQNAFTQRLIAVIYNPLNQYRVVLGVGEKYWQDASILEQINLPNSQGELVPLTKVVRIQPKLQSQTVSHEGGVPSNTFSFNLADQVSLSTALNAIRQAIDDLNLPSSIRSIYSGSANALQRSLATQPQFIALALVVLFIVLGILYGNLWHPFSVLSTLPIAAFSAFLGLLVSNTAFSVITFIAMMLLVGSSMKNAILINDKTLQLQQLGFSIHPAVFLATKQRMRPMLMTTIASSLTALPLIWGYNEGAEIRHPLGYTMLIGLFMSQLMTLYFTPCIIVFVEQSRRYFRSVQRHGKLYLPR